ncbi:uncharacterized protein [Anabrus simplex]|uniref:uncharacterized protein isoform X2 n=1 Tax=Anabrus simplex TaxID=316456 RepID=UPI0035A26802
MIRLPKRCTMLDKLRNPHMEREVAALRQELDETRKALRTQTARCRKLVAAFTARLRQKEQEERQGRELRDQQLSTVLRALLVLEARLRKEQREIQRQLQERDAVIRSQTLEIARLRRAARSESPRKQHRNEPPAVPSSPSGDKLDDTSCSRESNPEHGVQHIIKKLEKETERNVKKSPESSVRFDEKSIKLTTRRPLSADFEEKIQNGGLNFGMKNGSVTKSLENLDSCNSAKQDKYSYKSRTSMHGSETGENARNKRTHGSLESLLQDNIDSETSEATVVEISVVEEHYNKRNSGNDGNLKNIGKRFVKHQVIKPSECTLNRFKTNRQKEHSNNEEFVTKLDCEDAYGLDPVLDSDSGVFQGSSSEVSDSSLKSDCQDNSYQDQDDDMPNRDLYKDYQHNPVLECVSQILLRDEDDIMDTSVYRSHNDDSDRIEDLKKGRFNNLWPSIKEEHETEDEETNDTTVVQPISNVTTDAEKDKEDTQTSQASSDVKVPENMTDSKCDPKKSPSKDKVPSPPIKAQHLQEKACLLMSNQRLTLVRNPDFEEVDKKEESENRLKVSYQKAKVPTLPSQTRSSVPPALPPKPPQLGSMSRLRHKRNMFNTQLNQSPHPLHSQGTSSSHDSRQVLANMSENCHESGENNTDPIKTPKPPKSLDLHINYTHPIYQEKPRQRQILSNGSLKRALNHDSLPQDSRQYNHEHQEKNASKTFEEKLDELNLSAYRPPVKLVGPVAARVQRQLEARPTLHDSGRHQYLHDGLVDDQSGSKPNSSTHGTNCGAIKVGSSVSSLITGSTGGSIVTELTQGTVEASEVRPQISTSRHEELHHEPAEEHRIEENDGDEDGNATLRSNFEEFRLEDVDMDSVEEVGRPAGDGAECRTTQPSQNGNSSAGSYEHFLEATGLSQKSIMTPSRMLSNHRNVMKPKDVKHRSRVLRAAAVNERCGTVSGGPIVKYWIEPFL